MRRRNGGPFTLSNEGGTVIRGGWRSSIPLILPCSLR